MGLWPCSSSQQASPGGPVKNADGWAPPPDLRFYVKGRAGQCAFLTHSQLLPTSLSIPDPDKRRADL